MGAVRWATGAVSAVLVLAACATGTRAADPPSTAPASGPGRPGASSAPAATHGPGRAPSSASVPPSPAASAPATAAPRATTAQERLVAVTRSGGYAGQEKSLVVAGDGTYRRLDRGRQTGTGRLTAAGLDRLRAALAAADFPHLPPVSTDPHVFDAFTYAFTYDGREVTAQETVLPAALQRVLDALPEF